MPTVPYSPVPEVPISNQGVQGYNVPTPAAAFGASIGEAISSAGKSVQHASDEIYQRAIALQQLQNETEAREADAEYTIAMGDLRAKYHSLEGKNAVEQFPQYQRDVRALQTQYSASLTNPMSRRMFDRESRGVMARAIFSAAGHAATQNRSWAEKSSLARIDNTSNTTLQDPTPANRAAGESANEQESHNIAALNGWDEDQRQRFLREANSDTNLKYLRGLAKKDPFAAAEFFNNNRAKFDDKHLAAAEQIVKTNLYQTGSRRISEEINGAQPIEGGTNLETRIDEGMRKAKELAPGDEDFAGFVRDKIITDYNRQNSIRRDINLGRRQTIESGLMGQGSPDGRMPTTIEELKGISPETAEAWDSLPPNIQRSYLRALAQNAKGEISWTNEGLTRYQQLKGIAATDPTAFLGLNVVEEKMPSSARRELINLQQRLKQRPEADPRVTRALQTLRPMLRSAGIMPDQDKDRYYQFVGALQDQLAQFQQDKPGKFPTQEEVQKIGSNLIGNQREQGGWWRLGIPKNTALFELSLPDQLLQEFKNDPRWGNRTPTDAEIELFRRQYIRQQYQKLYGTAASGGAGAKPVPTQSFKPSLGNGVEIPMSR